MEIWRALPSSAVGRIDLRLGFGAIFAGGVLKPRR